MRAWFHLRSANFQPKTCENFVRMGLSKPLHDGGVGLAKTRADRKIRRSRVRMLERGRDREWEELMDVLTKKFAEANSEVFGLQTWPIVNHLQFTEYNAGDEGHYDWHEDVDLVSQHKIGQRKLSLVMQLSDPLSYKGGDLELACSGLSREEVRKRGTVIIFPSLLKHRVTPVTEGTRYSLVCWLEGPPWQ